MIPELGHFALILAAIVAVLQATLPFAGARREDVALMSLGRVAACVQALLIAFAFGCLVAAFAKNRSRVALTSLSCSCALAI